MLLRKENRIDMTEKKVGQKKNIAAIQFMSQA